MKLLQHYQVLPEDLLLVDKFSLVLLVVVFHSAILLPVGSYEVGVGRSNLLLHMQIALKTIQ